MSDVLAIRVLPTEPPPEEQPDTASFHLTDYGNAERMVHEHGHDMRYCGAWNTWLVWDGTRWAKDETGEVDRRAKATVREMYIEVRNEPDESRRTALAKHAMRSESKTRIAAMIALAESEASVIVRPSELDSDPWLFNCANGTIDLHTGELLPHRREDLITKRSPVAYDPDAECALWESFLTRAMDGDQETVSYLQRFAGYVLTGSTQEHCLMITWGPGRNGKSVFIGTLEYVMGTYAKQTRAETIMARDHRNQIPNDVAALVGARFVPTVEVDDGARLAESLVKQLTGGDQISARFLYAELFEFFPTFKICIATNHKPGVRGTDTAIWERIHLVPFSVVIPREERDPVLKEKLMAAGSGILLWMVKGCLEWQRRGLEPPPAVRAATEDYRDEMDLLAQFIGDCCVEEHRAITQSSKLYEQYSEWSKGNGERTWTQTAFGRKLRERGFQNERASGLRVWLGIGLKDETHA